MDRRSFPSDAEYYRHHRRCFELAQELGCTPADAEKELRRIEAREKDRAAADRLAAKMNAPLPQPIRFEQWDAPWMGRD